MNIHELLLISPEVVLLVTLIFVVIGEVTYFGEQIRLISMTAIVGLVAALVQAVMSYQHGAAYVFFNTMSMDGFSLFFKILFILLSVFIVIFAGHSKEVDSDKKSEFYVLVIGTTLVSCLAAAASNLFLIFLIFQFINISNYFIAGYGKNSIFSTEAAVKYMMFSFLSAAFFLNASAVFFVSTHSLNIYEIHKVFLENPLPDHAALIAFVFLFMSAAFQMAVFPMHLWVPDVLQGAPTPASCFLSFGPRIAGFVVFTRLLLVLFTQPVQGGALWSVLGTMNWPVLIAFISGATMLTGGLLALKQKSAKRMVGCLLLMNSGALLMGLLVLDNVGLSSAMYSLVVDLFALVGVFYILSFFNDELKSDSYEGLRSALSRFVPECICLVLFLFSLVGIPPMPGFIAKFGLIGAAVKHQWYFLALIAVASMTLALAAVARFIYFLIGDFKINVNSFDASGGVTSVERRLFLVFLLFPVLLVGIFAEYLLSWAGMSLGFIFW